MLEQIAPLIYAWGAERKVERKIHALRADNLAISLENGLEQRCLLKELGRFHRGEKDRRRAVDDKAKATLFIIGLSAAVMLAAVDLRNGQLGEIGWVGRAALAVGVLCLLASSLTCIKAVTVRQFYDLSLAELTTESEPSRNAGNPSERRRGIMLSRPGIGDEEKATELYRKVRTNELTTLIKTNYLSATLVGVRNGIILIFASLLVLLLQGAQVGDSAVGKADRGKASLQQSVGKTVRTKAQGGQTGGRPAHGARPAAHGRGADSSSRADCGEPTPRPSGPDDASVLAPGSR